MLQCLAFTPFNLILHHALPFGLWGYSLFQYFFLLVS